MDIEEKVLATVADLSREGLIDALDEYVGVGCQDEKDDERLRSEVLAAYNRGAIDGEEFVENYGDSAALVSLSKNQDSPHMTPPPKTTRYYAVPAGHYPFNSTVYPVDCVEQHGRFYACMNTLNASRVGVGNTVEEAFAAWQAHYNAKVVPGKLPL